jgi:hypothetical protein
MSANETTGFNIHHSGFDLREVEDVDQRQEVVTGRMDGFSELDLFRESGFHISAS